MVDVGDKATTRRVASAEAVVRMEAATLSRLRAGDTPKGDVLATVRLAGIMAAKKTSDIVPLCHPLSLSKVEVTVTLGARAVRIVSRVRCEGKTGVEREALPAASAGALALYDILKSMDRGMSFEVRLLEKDGGKSGRFAREATDVGEAP